MSPIEPISPDKKRRNDPFYNLTIFIYICKKKPAKFNTQSSLPEGYADWVNMKLIDGNAVGYLEPAMAKKGGKR